MSLAHPRVKVLTKTPSYHISLMDNHVFAMNENFRSKMHRYVRMSEREREKLCLLYSVCGL